jgi:hypothetical protein
MAAASPQFTGWATQVISFQPGPRQAGGNATPAAYGSAASVIGPPDAAGSEYQMPPAEGPVLSLGDGGQVTVAFAAPLTDGPGPDFAVFENGFNPSPNAIFAELAFVEVSSNGTDFARFPAISCTPVTVQTGAFGTLDPHHLHNLAGKHPAGYGTPFDLAELAGLHPLVDVRRISRVRLVDVVGDVRLGRGGKDAAGNWINDPYPTNFQTCGFDLDAIGVIHQAADPWQAWVEASFAPEFHNDPAVTGPSADPDGDGRSNLVEYACGSPPSSPDNSPLPSLTAGDRLILQFVRRADRYDTIVTLEQSSGGTNWSPVAAGDGIEITESGTPEILTTVTIPRAAAETRAFFRLRIERTPSS